MSKVHVIEKKEEALISYFQRRQESTKYLKLTVPGAPSVRIEKNRLLKREEGGNPEILDGTLKPS